MSKLVLFLPELFFLLLIVVLFIRILMRPNRDEALAWLPWAAFVGVLVALGSIGVKGDLFWSAYQVDSLSQFFKAAIAVGFFVAVLNALGTTTVDAEKRKDYFLFLTISAWGLMLLSSAVELVTMYVALEVSSYSLFALVPLRSNSREAAEAGVKYILFAAAATAVSLYGLSYIIATQHSTYLSDLAAGTGILGGGVLGAVGLVMFLSGFFYKLALFPFHFWTPDVYQGASNETTTFIATLPKLGAVVVLIRLATLFAPGMVPADVMAWLAALSMTYGNLAALIQKDVKRLLGYSGVAHAGYIILGIIAGTAAGLASAAFYALAYLFMNLTCFWVICRLSPKGENVLVEDLNGLARRFPLMAFALAVGAFALVGLPPTAGFMGKLFLFTSIWGQGYNWLVIVAALNSAVSIYYYLNLVRHAYTQEPGTKTVAIPKAGTLWAGVLAVCVLLLGIIPGPVYEWALQAGHALIP
ncbi:MAG: NADH-quinone oxidoreductase subunit N [Desulfovibrionales bacterium]